MKKIPVSELKPGTVYSQPVYIDPQNRLVEANEIISESDIERLKKWGIKTVQSDGEPSEYKPNVDEKAKEIAENQDLEKAKKNVINTYERYSQFQQSVTNGQNMIQDIYSNLIKEAPVQLSQVRSYAENLIDLVQDAPLCHVYLYLLQHEPSIERHVISAAIFGTELCLALDFSRPRTIDIINGILLMDVGMYRVPESIMNKEEKLTRDELKTLHAHPVHGYNILKNVGKVKNQIATVALQHHEHYDSTGYPRGMKGEEMSDATRVAAIADSYAAILEKKPYREALSPYQGMRELLSLGLYQYDPIYLKAFLNRMSMYPLGSMVETSTGDICLVGAVSEQKPMRPFLFKLIDKENNRFKELDYIHLMSHSDVYIVKARMASDLGLSLSEEFDLLAKRAKVHKS